MMTRAATLMAGDRVVGWSRYGHPTVHFPPMVVDHVLSVHRRNNIVRVFWNDGAFTDFAWSCTLEVA